MLRASVVLLLRIPPFIRIPPLVCPDFGTLGLTKPAEGRKFWEVFLQCLCEKHFQSTIFATKNVFLPSKIAKFSACGELFTSQMSLITYEGGNLRTVMRGGYWTSIYKGKMPKNFDGPTSRWANSKLRRTFWLCFFSTPIGKSHLEHTRFLAPYEHWAQNCIR